MAYETIKFNIVDAIATITLNRPRAANAQNTQLINELDAAFDAGKLHRAIRHPIVIVVVQRTDGLAVAHDHAPARIGHRHVADAVARHQQRRAGGRHGPGPEGLDDPTTSCVPAVRQDQQFGTRMQVAEGVCGGAHEASLGPSRRIVSPADGGKRTSMAGGPFVDARGQAFVLVAVAALGQHEAAVAVAALGHAVAAQFDPVTGQPRLQTLARHQGQRAADVARLRGEEERSEMLERVLRAADYRPSLPLADFADQITALAAPTTEIMRELIWRRTR